MSKIKTNIIVLCISSIFLLIVVELILRVFFPVWEITKLFCIDHDIGWTYCKNAKIHIGAYDKEFSYYLHINSKGWRDSEDRTNKTIIFLGDSFTSNIAIENKSKVFTEILEKEYLSDYSVVNLGVDGYNTIQEYYKLKKEGIYLNPRIVFLIFYAGNDPYENIDNNGTIFDRPYFHNDGTIKISTRNKNKVSANLRIFNLFSKIAEALHLITVPNPSLKIIEDSNMKFFSYNMTCSLIKQLNTELNNEGIIFHLILAPSIYQVNDNIYQSINYSNRYEINQVLLNCTKKNNISYFDLTKDLKEIEEKKHGLYFPINKHWTEFGNEVVANIIYKKFLSSLSGIGTLNLSSEPIKIMP